MLVHPMASPCWRLPLACWWPAAPSMNGLAPEASLRDANALRRYALARRRRRCRPPRGRRPTGGKRFGDPQLDTLMDEALAGSPTLSVAAARTRKALAFARRRASRALPAGQRRRVESRASASPSNGLMPPPFGGSWQTVNQLQVDAVAGRSTSGARTARPTKRALGQARAAEVDAYAARLALSTDIAHAYVQLQRAYLQLDVARGDAARARADLRADARSQRRRARLAARAEAGGIGAAGDARADRAARRDRSRSRATSSPRCSARAPIAVWRSRGPAATALARGRAAVDVPAELLGRRPDLVAQRWRVEAARKDIAVGQGASSIRT